MQRIRSRWKTCVSVRSWACFASTWAERLPCKNKALCSSRHTLKQEKEKKNPSGGKSVIRLNKNVIIWPQWAAICLEARRWGLSPQDHQTYCHVLLYAVGPYCCQWICCSKDSNWIMKEEDYLQIPQESSKSSVSRLGRGFSWVFQQGSDPKHTSKVVKEWLKQARVEILEWLSKVPTWTPSRTCGLCWRNMFVSGSQQI